MTFQFATTVDTSAFGGAPRTPLTVTYAFDVASPNGSGAFGASPPTSGSYGPVTVQIRLGNETISASGGGIGVFDNAGTSTVGESYEVKPSSFSGQLLGRSVASFRFSIADQDLTMFGDTALPLSPAFASAADFQQTELRFGDGSVLSVNEFYGQPSVQRTPFTLTVAPMATLAASEVRALGTTLNGTVNPSGLSTTVYFEYGLTTAYGLSTGNQDLGSGSIAVPVRAALIGLVPSETYHFRMVSVNNGRTTYGLDQTFTTLPSTLTATPLVFQFETTVDTTEFGGAPGTPMIVTYAFDPALPDGSGPFVPYPPQSASYGPLTMQIRLGKETISASGGGIGVYNNAGPDVEDIYNVRPSDWPLTFSGKLLGKEVEFFAFWLIDDGAMFSGTALPSSVDFAAAADYQQTILFFADGSAVMNNEHPSTPSGERTPFTLKVAPLATLAGSAVSSKDGILNGSVNPQGGAPSFTSSMG